MFMLLSILMWSVISTIILICFVLYSIGVCMKFYVSIVFLLFGLSIVPVFAQEQQCSYLAPREVSFWQSLFSSSIPLCWLPDITISNESYHSSPERGDIENRKQQLKLLMNNAYTALHDVSDKQKKADLKSAISVWRKELLALNYKMIVSYKNEYLEKITGK